MARPRLLMKQSVISVDTLETICELSYYSDGAYVLRPPPCDADDAVEHPPRIVHARALDFVHKLIGHLSVLGYRVGHPVHGAVTLGEDVHDNLAALAAHLKN